MFEAILSAHIQPNASTLMGQNQSPGLSPTVHSFCSTLPLFQGKTESNIPKEQAGIVWQKGLAERHHLVYVFQSSDSHCSNKYFTDNSIHDSLSLSYFFGVYLSPMVLCITLL